MSGSDWWGQPPSSDYLRKKAQSKPKTKKERLAEEKITEQHLCDILNGSCEYHHERYIVLDKNDEESVQYIMFDGSEYLCPDVKVYKDSWNEKLIMRIEVKRKEFNFEDGYENSRYNIFYVDAWKFNEYYKFHLAEEIPFRIAFVVGEPNSFKEMYWQNIDKLNETKYLERNTFGDGQDFFIWDISKLKKINPDNFYNDLFE